MSDELTDETHMDAKSDELIIIGIGSSAGGLEAIRQLANTLPGNLPVSYVVAQHMSPHHKSLMTALVARDASIKVLDVTDGTIPEANVIYITPPRTDVIITNGVLRLVEPSPQVASPKPSVDRFLISLAQDRGEKSIAIILSGTGSDGAYGIQAVREAGGITMAQDNASAKYDGMPQAATQTGCVDLVLSPEEIGEYLPRILTSPRDFSEFRSQNLDVGPHSDLLQILLARTQVDFRDYKPTTIARRIQRRMVALNIQSEEEYTQFCRHNPSAVDALFKDLLISVTRFFRDSDAYDRLSALLPRLIELAGGDQIRIWIAGCATGEEAYSIAMIMCEALGGSISDFKNKVQIFATDIDKDALTVARRGVYSLFALNDIPQKYATKYLIRQNDEVRVIDSLRRAVLFSDHNVCQSPPFQRIDLVCCRNLLIYFSNGLQRKVMERFHYAMTENALLFLGTAESVAGSDELFVPDRDASHVFRKRMLRKTEAPGYSMPNMSRMRREPRDAAHSGVSTDRHLLQALARSLGDNSILVTEEFHIAEVFGDVSAYISLSNSTNLRMHLDLLRSPLREEARSLITIALKYGKMRSGVRHLLAEQDTDHVRLDVYPIVAETINERAALVVFTPLTREDINRFARSTEDNASDANNKRIIVLENEVAATREALQQTIEELETSNEELQSVNEELQSTNEELQATNEELETSNEELQSTNEELITVNEELQITATELTGRSSELASVLQSTPLAILVTDTALQVTQATNTAIALFSLKEPVISPHISQCVLPEGYPVLAPVCIEALRMGETIKLEFNSHASRIMLTCSPYFNAHGRVTGVTLVATEFPGLAQEMEMILNSEQIYIVHRTQDGTILRVSKALATLFGSAPDDMVGKDFNAVLQEFDALPPQAGAALSVSQEASGALLAPNKSDETAYVMQFVPSGQTHPVWHSVRSVPYRDPITKTDTIYSIGVDITTTIKQQRSEREMATTIQLVQDMASVGNWSVDLVAGTVYWSREVHRIHRTDPNNYRPDLASGINFYHEDDREDVSRLVQLAIDKGEEFRFVKRIVAADGADVRIESFGVPILDEAGLTTKIVGVFREVAPSEVIEMSD